MHSDYEQRRDEMSFLENLVQGVPMVRSEELTTTFGDFEEHFVLTNDDRHVIFPLEMIVACNGIGSSDIAGVGRLGGNRFAGPCRGPPARRIYLVEELLLLTDNPIHREKLMFHKLSLDPFERSLRNGDTR